MSTPASTPNSPGLGQYTLAAEMTFFIDRAIAAVRSPGPETLGLLAVALALIVALVWLLRRMLRGRARADAPPPKPHGD